MHQQPLLADPVAVVAFDLDIVDRLRSAHEQNSPPSASTIGGQQASTYAQLTGRFRRCGRRTSTGVLG